METDLQCRVDASKAKKEASKKTIVVMVSFHFSFLLKIAITPLQCICQVIVLYLLVVVNRFDEPHTGYLHGRETADRFT